MKIWISFLVACLFSSQVINAQTQTAQKYINIELLTNTWCPLCATYDPPAIATYMANKKDIHLLSYHPDVPYPQCPFNQANVTDNNARKTYYNVNSTPRTFTLGTQQNTSNNLITQSNINSYIGQTSPLRVEVIENVQGTNGTVSVNVKSFDTPPTGDIRLFVAAVVEDVNFNAQNGLTDHHNVLWKFLSSENGDPFTPSAVNGTSAFSFTYDTNNLTHASFQASEVYTIAFVQNYATKEVYNSGSSKDIIVDATITDDACNGSGAIDIDVSGGDGNYTIFWSNGMQVEDISNLAAGNYTVVITDGSGAEVESIITVQGSSGATTLSGLPPFTSSILPITLIGSPPGGTFSGPGVVFSAFNPSLAGPGTHTITYTDPCGNSTSQNILVFTVSFNFVNYSLGTISP